MLTKHIKTTQCDIIEYRCAGCGKLLLKGCIEKGAVEIKCKKCKTLKKIIAEPNKETRIKQAAIFLKEEKLDTINEVVEKMMEEDPSTMERIMVESVKKRPQKLRKIIETVIKENPETFKESVSEIIKNKPEIVKKMIKIQKEK